MLEYKLAGLDSGRNSGNTYNGKDPSGLSPYSIHNLNNKILNRD